MPPTRASKKSARADATPPKIVELALLLADEDEWRGHCGRLRLTLTPGSGLTHLDGALGPAARQAAEIGAAVALGAARSRWDVAFELQLPPTLPASVIDGDSLGLPAAVAVRAAATGQELPEKVAFTGRVDTAGRAGPVGGMRLKAAAAVEAGLERLITGSGCEITGDLPQEEVATLEALWERLWPARPSRRPPLSPLLLLLAPLLALSGLSTRQDHALSQALLAAVSDPLPARETAIVALPDLECDPSGRCQSFRDRRARLAPLLAELVAAGARSISLDLDLNRPNPADPALAAAMDDAVSAGVPIVLAMRWQDGQGLLPPGDPELAALVASGRVREAHAQGEGEPGHVLSPGRIRLRLYHGRWIWHSAVVTVASWSPGVGPPRFEEGPLGRDQLVIGPLRATTSDGRLTLRPVAPSPCWLWVEQGWSAALPGCVATDRLRDVAALRGRAVWIGVRTPLEDSFTFLGQPVSGVDVQAAATEVLAAGAAPRELAVGVVALLTLALGPLWLLGRALLRGGRLPTLLLGALPLAGLAAGAALGVVIAPLPVLLATSFGIIVSEAMSRRNAQPVR